MLAVPLGVALLVQARALALRRRRALGLSIWLLARARRPEPAKGLDVEEALLSWALAGLLYWGRAAFYVRSEVGTLPAALRGAAIVAVTTVATAWSRCSPRRTGPRRTAAFMLDVREALGLLTLTGGPLTLDGPFESLPWVLGILGVGALVAIAAILFRPLRGARSQCPVEHDEACALVREHGTDTLSYFKLRRDLSHLWSADRRAFLAYRVEHGVLVVSGDPSGRPTRSRPAARRAGLRRPARPADDGRRRERPASPSWRAERDAVPLPRRRGGRRDRASSRSRARRSRRSARPATG